MSRTDKDRPIWVRARDPHEPTTVHHYHAQTHWMRYYDLNSRNECELAALDNSKPAKHPSYTCYRDIAHWANGGHPYYHNGHIPYPKHHRTHTRNALRAAAKEYNTNRELDDYDYNPPANKHWWDPW